MAALRAGATDTVEAATDAEAGGYDVVIECVGRPELAEVAAGLVRARGRVVITGAGVEPFSIEPIAALLKELTVRFSVAYRPSEFREVVAAFADGTIDPAPLLGPRLGLDRVADAFDLVANGAADGRVLVVPAPPSGGAG
jgi:threonine dehydrogenase-like Zn-dependent dehydrogenase